MPSMVPKNPAPLPQYVGTDWSRLGGKPGFADYYNALASRSGLNPSSTGFDMAQYKNLWDIFGGDPARFWENATQRLQLQSALSPGKFTAPGEMPSLAFAQAPGFTQASTPSNYGAGWRGASFGPSGRTEANMGGGAGGTTGGTDTGNKGGDTTLPPEAPQIPTSAGGNPIPGGFGGQTMAVAPQQAAIANWWQQVQQPTAWAQPKVQATAQTAMPPSYTGLPTYTNPWAIQKPKTKTYPTPRW